MTKPKDFFICKLCNKLFIPLTHIQNYCSLECAFWSKVNPKSKKECWEWFGSKHKMGYGEFRFTGKLYRSHRVSYELHIGKIKPNMSILHSCDNPSCVNPNHLYQGTQRENMKDVSIRNRNSSCRKLSPSDVLKIKLLLGYNCNQSKLAKEYNVTSNCINLIAKGKNWKYI